MSQGTPEGTYSHRRKDGTQCRPLILCQCILDASETACARCVDLGYECELPQLLLAEEAEADEHEAQSDAAPEPTPARRRHKCDTCRRHHMTVGDL